MIENGYRRPHENDEPGPKQFYCRETINDRIGLIVQIFRWGLTNELVPAENVTALEAVEGLRKGEEVNVREMLPGEVVQMRSTDLYRGPYVDFMLDISGKLALLRTSALTVPTLSTKTKTGHAKTNNQTIIDIYWSAKII